MLSSSVVICQAGLRLLPSWAGLSQEGSRGRRGGGTCVLFAGLSCSAGYPEAPVTRWMIRANCSAGAWSTCSSCGWCLVKAAWSCSFLLIQGTVLSWTSSLPASLPAQLSCRHPLCSHGSLVDGLSGLSLGHEAQGTEQALCCLP